MRLAAEEFEAAAQGFDPRKTSLGASLGPSPPLEPLLPLPSIVSSLSPHVSDASSTAPQQNRSFWSARPKSFVGPSKSRSHDVRAAVSQTQAARALSHKACRTLVPPGFLLLHTQPKGLTRLHVTRIHMEGVLVRLLFSKTPFAAPPEQDDVKKPSHKACAVAGIGRGRKRKGEYPGRVGSGKIPAKKSVQPGGGAESAAGDGVRPSASREVARAAGKGETEDP
ncbi:hypothetical protein Esti_002841 [Eimeria stiedai]